MVRSRGRPRNTEQDHDRLIAVAVLSLLRLAHPGRSGHSENEIWSGVYEAVGIAAKNVLERTDGQGRALGPDRVEQIYEQNITHYYSEQEKKLGFAWKFRRGRVKKMTLLRHKDGRPTTSRRGTKVEARRSSNVPLAEILLKNKGEFPLRDHLAAAVDLADKAKDAVWYGDSPPQAAIAAIEHARRLLEAEADKVRVEKS